MSALDDKINAVKTASDAAIARVTADLAKLRAQIAAGEPTETQLATLDGIAANLNALDAATTTAPAPASPPSA